MCQHRSSQWCDATTQLLGGGRRWQRAPCERMRLTSSSPSAARRRRGEQGGGDGERTTVARRASMAAASPVRRRDGAGVICCGDGVWGARATATDASGAARRGVAGAGVATVAGAWWRPRRGREARISACGTASRAARSRGRCRSLRRRCVRPAGDGDGYVGRRAPRRSRCGGGDSGGCTEATGRSRRVWPTGAWPWSTCDRRWVGAESRRVGAP